jgi:large subunit ribosomal protein L35
MPKMKTVSGAKKRFRVTGSGKIRMNHSFKRHILTKKGTKQKRNLTYASYVNDADMGNVKLMLTIGK